ncbi:hypothetical protein B0T17DRAFT_481537 [Bombardia bombarda]|uniref:Uncharacterized protein n=1 Tax=Bombardia bombarda TaxID=252184 RepID=A0AA39XKA6_9PEZI|nr:hypothetical protein B0T17DRAFT_481537 [Bombardia bombarda]
MTEPKKKGFWSLFRSKSSATKSGKLKENPLRRVSEGDGLGQRRRRSDVPLDSDHDRDRRMSKRAPEGGKGRARGMVINGRSYDAGPLTEWPPSGMSSHEELTLGPAMHLISRGVPVFRGHKRPIPHASDQYYALFATAAGNRGDDTDAANQHDSMTQLMTLRILGSGPAVYPWETLEQPSCSFCFGNRPGTITLNHWASMASVLPPPIALRDPGVAPREIELDRILERLKELERRSLDDDDDDDDDEDLMYKNLYRRLLRDPDRYVSPHRTLDKQITDLIMVLSRADWIDFTQPRNQVVTKFIFDPSPSPAPADLRAYHRFFHQLLLSVELDLRINSKHHLTEAKEKLLLQIPPTLQWDLALARRWRQNVRVDAYGRTPAHVRLRLKLKKRQVKMLKRFAQMMKWPNLAETLACLRQRDEENTLDLVSSHALAFFSGLVLPGPTFPFLIMNALIDMDPDKATDELALLTHMHPHCGFQYRNSYTYWTAASVVGKVLAPTCHAVAGWVGPARPTVDLGRSQIARIRSRKPPGVVRSGVVLTAEDVRGMSERSDPLGLLTEVFPVEEYRLVSADMDGDGEDLVRIEMLSLKPCVDRGSGGGSAGSGSGSGGADPGLRWFDASLQFAIDGVSWPLRLAFDVSFICAWPCSDGPHPLFCDYLYRCTKPDELVGIKNWNGLYGGHPHDRNARSLSPVAVGRGDQGGGGRGVTRQDGGEGEDEEEVLVVEAFGVPDNEVLARAWCSRWGLSAVVADVGKTCMACAIREAYAAKLTVVILVEGDQYAAAAARRDG